MKPSPDNLEKLIHQTLRSLPDRRAPHTLEARVMAAIEARAALPWWRQSFAQWPVVARCGFLLVSGGLVKVALLAAVWVMTGFDNSQYVSAFAEQFVWFEHTRAAVESVGHFLVLIYRNIPSLWLYGSLAVLASLYAALFGLGAAAYRTLYSNR